MFKVFLLDIKTASSLFEKLVECVVLPGVWGEISLMSFHRPIVLKLKKGIIWLDKQRVVIKEGLAKMENNELVILVETKEGQSIEP